MIENRYKKIEDTNFIGEEGLQKLQNSRILILGAGGIGSNLVQNIIATGIKHLGLVDNDLVAAKNLSVQILYNEHSIGKFKVDECKKWVNNYDSSIDIKTWTLRLNENNWQDIVKDYDIIMGAFDTTDSVKLMNKIAIQTNKPIINGGISNDFGYVWTTLPHKTPCHSCFVEFDNYEIPQNIGIIEPICAIVAGLMTWEVVKLVLNKGSLIGVTPMYINALNSTFKRPRVYKSLTEKCPVCGLPRLSLTPFDENCIS